MMRTLLLKLLLVCLSLAAYTVKADNAPVIYGSLIYSTGWGSMANPPYAMCSVVAEEPLNITMLQTGPQYEANGGGVYVDGKYYMISYTTSIEGAVMDITYKVFDVEKNWTLIRSVPQEDISSIATDLAYDPTTDRIYGCFWNPDDTFKFGVLNRMTGKPDIYTTLSEQLVALAANRDGAMYAIGISGRFYRVNVSGRTVTLDELGTTGLTVRYAQSACFDLAKGKLYWAATMYDTSKSNGIYEVNTENGAVSRCVELTNGYELAGIYVLDTYAKADAPAKVQSLSYDYSRGSRSGNITFTLPGQTVSGTTLSGELTYHVLIDEKTMLTGTGMAGQTVSVPHAFSSDDMHVFSVSAANSSGRGPVIVDYAFIGQDIPRAENVVMQRTATGLSLTWDAPAVGINGGYIPVSSLTYKVVRYPGATEVYSGAATSFAEELDTKELDIYWYTVTTYAGTREGETVESNKMKLGEARSIPYREDFSSQDSYTLYTIADQNNDGHFWSYGVQSLMYEYNEAVPADDWAFTPALRLSPDYVYQLTFNTRCDLPEYVENLRVAMGMQPTAEAMTSEVLPRYDINWDRYKEQTAILRPQTADFSYIGFQVCSEANAYFLYLDDVQVTELTSVHAPDTVTSFTVTPGFNGAMSANLSFVLPSRTIAGNALEAITKMDIYRDNVLLETFGAGLKPGMPFTYTDTKASAGENVYTVYVCNDRGQGLETAASVYVGEDIPLTVRNLQVTDMGGGEVKLTWEAPLTGQNGGFVNADKLTYTITNVGGMYGKTIEVSGLSYTDHVTLGEGTQRLAWYEIAANSDKGSSDKLSTDTVFLGNPYDLPYNESFSALKSQRGPWLMTGDNLALWRCVAYGSANPQDDDAGEMQFLPYMAGASAGYLSPKISLSGSVNPILSFWVWHYKHSGNTLTVKLLTASGEEIMLQEIKQNETGGEETEWVNYRIPLEKYISKVGEYCQLLFIGNCESYDEFDNNVLYLDNIEIRSHYEYDLSAGLLSAGTSVKVGETIEFTLPVCNVGVQSVAEYKVELYRDGKLVDAHKGVPLPAYEQTVFTFKDTPNADASAVSKYRAVVNFGADLKLDNNESNIIEVNILPGLPYVNTLSGSYSSTNSLVLSWENPVGDTEESEAVVTEDFESYSAFTIANMGQWTLYDGDGSETGGIIDYSVGDYYQYDNAEAPMAYQVFNPSAIGLSGIWAARSGEQALVSFISTQRGNDDWIISPQVDGAQTITFWAKAPDCTYFETAETIEVLYSTTTTDISAFTIVGDPIIVNYENWRMQSVDLPEGTKYFAIRNVSRNQFILFIDDITYRPAKDDLVLQGYNVYCNGQKVNEALVTEPTYEVQSPVDGQEYQVTAVYNQGESILSNSYIAGVTSIGGTAVQAVTVRGLQGCIEVTNAEGLPVSVYSMTGQLRYSGEGNAVIPVESGIFLVKTGRVMTKIVVR